MAEAAIRAPEERDVDLILPYVHESGEDEVRRAFEKAGATRAIPEAHELADRWFVETVVRVHRAGEGAPNTGLMAAGLDVVPVSPAAERAIEMGRRRPSCKCSETPSTTRSSGGWIGSWGWFQAHRGTVAEARESVGGHSGEGHMIVFPQAEEFLDALMSRAILVARRNGR